MTLDAALELADELVDAGHDDEAHRVILAAADLEHAGHVAGAHRALAQTIKAGHAYAALPHALEANRWPVRDRIPAGRCGAVWRPGGAAGDPVTLVCLLEVHPIPGGHGWAGRENGAAQLLEQVDPIARIVRRAAAARA